MLGHVSFGVSDLERAIAFYDAALAPLGLTRSGQSRTPLGMARPEEETFSLSSSNDLGLGRPARAFILLSTPGRTLRSTLFIPRPCEPAGPIMATLAFGRITGRPIMPRS
jgi:catechol 2,3-dioxygenase-like lactoylglutathione lyase family enzyme